MPKPPLAPAQTARSGRLDALRGGWMLWMAAFHFAFDLAHFRLIDANFYADPLWTTQRTLILSGFLFWAGVGQGLALQAQQSARRFWQRWAQVAGAAVLVSAGSAVMFPNSWISFGVLHAFAVMLPLLRWGASRWSSPVVLGAALLCLLAPLLWQHPLFDSRWTNWVGLNTHKPITEDFVPLLPWAAPLLLGLLAARSRRVLAWLQGEAPAAVRPVARLGQWPLSFYLLHQPVLIGGLLVWQRV